MLNVHYFYESKTKTAIFISGKFDEKLFPYIEIDTEKPDKSDKFYKEYKFCIKDNSTPLTKKEIKFLKLLESTTNFAELFLDFKKEMINHIYSSIFIFKKLESYFSDETKLLLEVSN